MKKVKIKIYTVTRRGPTPRSYNCNSCKETLISEFYPKCKNKCKSCIAAKAKLIRLNPERINIQKQYYYDNIIRIRLYQAKKRATSKGWEFNLTPTFIKRQLKAQDNKCYYSSHVFDNTSSFYSMSLDRTNSEKGYIQNNIKLVLSSVNIMKLDMSENEFLSLIESIYINNKKNNF